MKIIRFMDDFVDAILSGRKTSTMRQNTNRIPNVGEYVTLSSKERPEFAIAFVKYVDENPIINPSERRALRKIYGGNLNKICRIHFVLHATSDSA